MAHEDGPRKILELGRNVWKTTRPEAAGVLVDAAAYYRAFYAAALGAKRTILLAGWQFDSGVPLLRGSDATPGAEVRLVRFLNELCERNPELEVHILAWDFHAIFALEREWMQTAYFEWATNERLHFRFDDTQAAQGSHHQKFVVIDRSLSFLGGIDLCEARWDDRRHRTDNPLRLSRGQPSKPYHDVQVYLAGCDPADVLRELFIDRWARSGGPSLTLPTCDTRSMAAYAPRGALPLGTATVALSRTDARAPQATIREIERLFVTAIGAAERLIYIETQYFSSRAIGDALIERMRAADRQKLEIVIVLNAKPEAFKEEVAVGLGQTKTLTRLARAANETGHHLGVYGTLSEGEGPGRPATYIHSKLLIVDDRFLTIGSANLTNRSMGVDTELQASWEVSGDAADDRELEERIRALRVSLLAEHAGFAENDAKLAPPELARSEGLVVFLEALAAQEGARLFRLDAASTGKQLLIKVVDPEVLPFDPAEPDFDVGSDGWEEEHEQSRTWFTSGISALRDKLKLT